MNIVGVVLAGGQSSRYGKPKMFEQYKGKAFYEHSVDALSTSQIDSVFIVTNHLLASKFARSDARVLIEEETHNGPLYALTFAMKEIPHADWYVVLAADIPYISSKVIDALVKYTYDSDYDAIVPVTGEKEQPLVAIYHRRCLPFAEEILSENRRSMRPLLQKMNVNYIQFSSSQKEFTNINYERDWSEEHE
ncbi:molybdenum cofactor guanylyltransferase [Alkalihalobacillus sp. MEB130]|uniref:molybdenum cofactor guanylyltransferase n=1 Tax=Alkalihalobacillus sp. MEB130 TaxID=2976704 RepID=UPI0028DD75A6|nr:molybdenum cofactor guanylyltransferase [Alkalihalobacillus sp. MEB130]MDT8862387.1 molybdenum cofactor guanylyltransferase [Alkalihalobacillus sp. MEB130]